MSNLSRTRVQSRNTLDPRSYDSDDNSGELVDRLRQDGEILGVHVDLISRTPNNIRFDETEPERSGALHCTNLTKVNIYVLFYRILFRYLLYSTVLYCSQLYLLIDNNRLF